MRSQWRIERATETVGEENEPAVPARRHLDQVSPALVGAPPADSAAIAGRDRGRGRACDESEEDHDRETESPNARR